MLKGIAQWILRLEKNALDGGIILEKSVKEKLDSSSLMNRKDLFQTGTVLFRFHLSARSSKSGVL